MHFGRNLFLVSFFSVVFLVILLVLLNSNRISTPLNSDRPSATIDNITMYCAAGIKKPVAIAAKTFEKKYGVRVNLEYGGSGTLLSKLSIAKRGDLYLAADQSYIEIARAKGLISEQLPLAYMHPVLAVAKGNPKNIRTINDLFRTDVRIALANPEAASIGKLTKKILLTAGIWEKVKVQVVAKGVFKPTAPDVTNDVELGGVDVAVTWDALVNQYPKVEPVSVPEFDVAKKNVTIGGVEPF